MEKKSSNVKVELMQDGSGEWYSVGYSGPLLAWSGMGSDRKATIGEAWANALRLAEVYDPGVEVRISKIEWHGLAVGEQLRGDVLTSSN